MRVVYIDLPYEIYGFIREDIDGFQTVVINSHYNFETAIETYKHENNHAYDFGQDYDVNMLEKIRNE